MEKNEQIDVADGNELMGTEVHIFETISSVDGGTELDEKNVTFTGKNSTDSKIGIPVKLQSVASTVNYNKPWRQVIRRRIAYGRDDNESQD